MLKTKNKKVSKRIPIFRLSKSISMETQENFFRDLPHFPFDFPLENYLDTLFYLDGRGECTLIRYNEKKEEYTFSQNDCVVKIKIGTRPRGSDGMGELIVLDEMSIFTPNGWLEIEVIKELDEYYTDFWIEYLSDIRVDVNGHLYSTKEDELENSSVNNLNL